MKKYGTAPLVALLVMLAAARAFAQNVILDSGFTEQTLFNVQDSVTGFDLDSSGNIYYMQGPGLSIPADTQITESTASSGYTSATTLVDYNTPVYGDFLTLHNSTLFYGESTAGNVSYTGLPVASPPATPTFLANMPGNYDLEFSGTTATTAAPATTAFVSANLTFADNSVYALNINTGAYVQVLDTGGDYSGPIAFTSAGDLLYGESGGTPAGGGIYLFTAAQVNTAITSGTSLQISNGTEIINNVGNSDFAVVGNDLFQAFNQYGGTASLTLYNLSTMTSTPIGTVDNSGDFFAGIRDLDGNLVVADTDNFSTTNFIEIEPVPEPGSAWLGLAGLVIVMAFGRKCASA